MHTLASFDLPDDAATEHFGAALAAVVKPGWTIYLYGDLGAGKTTLARAVLRALGYSGKVKSPTYTLIEPYTLPDLMVYHLDLYRLGDPEELEYIGLRDLLDTPALLLVEWPERGYGYLPPATLTVHLLYQTNGRRCTLAVESEKDAVATRQLLQWVASVQQQ